MLEELLEMERSRMKSALFSVVAHCSQTTNISATAWENLKTTHRGILQLKTRDSSTSDLSSRTLLCDAQYNRSSQISDHLNTATIWSSLELRWRDDVSLAWLCPLISTGLFTLTTIRQSKEKPESVCDWRRRGPQTKWSWAHDDSATTNVSSDTQRSVFPFLNLNRVIKQDTVLYLNS